MHGYYDTPMGWAGFVMMALFMLVFYGGLIALGVILVRRVTEHGGSALRVLEERLARGDIDTDEFDRIRKSLRRR